MVKGEASFEQWSYELQTLRQTYQRGSPKGGDSEIIERGCSGHSLQLWALVPPWTPSLKSSPSFMGM